MTWAHLSHEIKALDIMNNSGLWFMRTTPGRHLKVIDAMNSLGLWITWATLGRELRPLDAMNSSR